MLTVGGCCVLVTYRDIAHLFKDTQTLHVTLAITRSHRKALEIYKHTQSKFVIKIYLLARRWLSGKSACHIRSRHWFASQPEVLCCMSHNPLSPIFPIRLLLNKGVYVLKKNNVICWWSELREASLILPQTQLQSKSRFKSGQAYRCVLNISRSQ